MLSLISIRLEPVNLSYIDSVRHFYAHCNFDKYAGVKVGIIDSGVDNHQDLNLAGGRNTVTGENTDDYGPAGSDHGTHVAGLVGANGRLNGIAPGVELRSYRVFGKGAKGASNYAIIKAMIFAAIDGCDIINLSLGGSQGDYITEEAVRDTRNNGILIVAAAGNDVRSPVSFPAAYQNVVAVSAMGHKGTFPTGSLHDSEIASPYGTDPDNFVASFTNIGPEIDVIAPGVGTLSTLPNNQYGPMSGTSMATPVICGVAASLLSKDTSVMNMNRNHTRSDSIKKLLFRSTVSIGFGVIFEGIGNPKC